MTEIEQTETNTQSETYNGWKNRATWNISLWIGNDENVYGAAHAAVDTLRRRGTLESVVTPSWAKAFATIAFEEAFDSTKTPDGYSVDDADIDWSAIADMIRDL